jgi:hypothetical protein
MPYNKLFLEGKLYLQNAEQILSKKIVVDGKIMVKGKNGSYILARLLNTHDVILEGYLAVQALAFTKANGDVPLNVFFSGELLSRNGLSIPKAEKLDFIVPETVSEKAREIMIRLQNKDTFLAASFENTVLQHQQELSNIYRATATAE